MSGIFKALLNGLHERGDGGFLYVRGEDCVYMFPHELHNQDALRDGLQELLEGDAAHTVFYVAEEISGNAHVLAYPRATVHEVVQKEILDSSPNKSPPSSNNAECESNDLSDGGSDDPSTRVPRA